MEVHLCLCLQKLLTVLERMILFQKMVLEKFLGTPNIPTFAKTAVFFVFLPKKLTLLLKIELHEINRQQKWKTQQDLTTVVMLLDSQMPWSQLDLQIHNTIGQTQYKIINMNIWHPGSYFSRKNLQLLFKRRISSILSRGLCLFPSFRAAYKQRRHTFFYISSGCF